MAMEAALTGWMASKRVAVFTAVLALVCLLGEVVYCWRAPAAYFDTMAYVSLVDGGGNGFAKAGDACSAELPGKWNGCGVVSGSAMFREVAGYPDADFAQMERFYTVKPLYVGLASGLHRWAGVSAFTGLRLISAGSFLLIGVVSWAWLQEHLPVAVAPVAAFWMTAYGPVLWLGKDLLPDGISTALLLGGMYLVLYRTKAVGAVLLALALLARPDNMLLIACCGVAWIWPRQQDARRRWMSFGLLLAGCAAVSFALGKATGALPWAVLFRRSFFELLPPARFATAHVSLREYAHVMGSNGVRTVMFCLPAAIFLGTLAMVGDWLPSRLKPLTGRALDVRAEARTLQGQRMSMRSLVLASMAAVGLRVLVYPGVEERYYVWFFLVCALAAACTMAERAGLGKERVCTG